jgi:hypothetical protein
MALQMKIFVGKTVGVVVRRLGKTFPANGTYSAAAEAIDRKLQIDLTKPNARAAGPGPRRRGDMMQPKWFGVVVVVYRNSVVRTLSQVAPH